MLASEPRRRTQKKEGGAAPRTEGPAEPEGAPPAHGCWTRTIRAPSRAGERSTGRSGRAGTTAGTVRVLGGFSQQSPLCAIDRYPCALSCWCSAWPQ